MSDQQSVAVAGEPRPVVSVVTVCFNSAATLAATLQSVVEQTLKDIEHIVIDGGSDDGTLQVTERFRAGLAHVVSEPDHGIYDAMNKGLALARGNIVCFLNADDVYAHDAVLADVAEAMNQHRLDALFGDVVFFRNAEPDRVVRRYRSRHFRPSTIGWGWMPAHPALFLRREVFERMGHFRTDYRIAGDFEFVARVFSKNDLNYRYHPQVLVRMRMGGISTAGWRSRVLLNREVLRACRENGIRTNMLKILAKYPAKFFELLRR